MVDEDKPVFLHLGQERFRAPNEIPIGALMELAASDEDSNEALADFRHFLFACVEEDEEKRLKKLLRRKRTTVYETDEDGELVLDEDGEPVVEAVLEPVGMDDITEALERLYKDMADRPTKPSSSSRGGSKKTAPKLQGGSPSQVTRLPGKKSKAPENEATDDDTGTASASSSA